MPGLSVGFVAFPVAVGHWVARFPIGVIYLSVLCPRRNHLLRRQGRGFVVSSVGRKTDSGWQVTKGQITTRPPSNKPTNKFRTMGIEPIRPFGQRILRTLHLGDECSQASKDQVLVDQIREFDRLNLSAALSPAELTDQHLQRIVTTWPTLPEALKAAILAIINSVSDHG